MSEVWTLLGEGPDRGLGRWVVPADVLTDSRFFLRFFLRRPLCGCTNLETGKAVNPEFGQGQVDFHLACCAP